jgi:hypothetical protein
MTSTMTSTTTSLITKASGYDAEPAAIEELADAVGAALQDIKEPIGTGALITRLLPECKDRNHPTYRLAVSALSAVRRREDCAHLWKYTGRKNHFGKPSLRWLPQGGETEQ